MTNMYNLAHTSIRLAISREDYRRALQLWNAYVGALCDALRRGELTRADIGEAEELSAWGILVLRGARTHLQAQVNKAHGVAAYSPRPATSGLVRTSL